MSMQDMYTTPGHLIRRAQQIAVALFMEECAAFELTPVQYAAMLAIREHPGIDATRLAGLIALDRPTIGGVLERLEARGLLVRESTSEDKRIKLIYLAAEGKRSLRRAESSVQRAQERILEPLSPSDRIRLIELLSRIVDLHNEVSRAPHRPLDHVVSSTTA
jgi:DNA-binding MarR family transcriptional regulator